MLSAKSLSRGRWGPFDLELRPGQCVVLTGKSGAGKTVLLRMLADLDPSEGSVTLGGVDRMAMPAPSWRRQIMFVHAESGWWADRVGEHFAEPERARALLANLLLPDDALDWPVARASTGEKQRLALARALALKPRALLLDEPTSALDQTATLAVEALLRAQLDQGVAILLVSHSDAQAERLGDRRLTMVDGRLTETTA
jgi:ABC-type iron transport system FetAB ATPase subunit